MSPKSAEEKSAEKIKLLRDPVISAAFLHYFNQDWQAKELLDELQAAGAVIQHLREWALWSFHPLGKDEVEEKRKRGQLVKTQLKSALNGYNNAIACYSWYAATPHFGWTESSVMSKHFEKLVNMNQYLAKETQQILERATATTTFATKRLGVNWNSSYLYLSKIYVAKFTCWEDRKVLRAVTHLIAGAKKSLRNRLPKDLRSLLRKAIREFETDPKNATIVVQLQKAVADPNVLVKMFPPLTPTSH